MSSFLENASSHQEKDIKVFIEKIEMTLVNSRIAQSSNYTSSFQHRKLHEQNYGIISIIKYE